MADMAFERARVDELLVEVNGIITPAQFSGSSLLMIYALKALCAEYAKPNTRLCVLVDEESTLDASAEFAKLFSYSGNGFESCLCMSEEGQLTPTKLIFLETILATCKATPLVVMNILKQDFDEAKTELDAARSEISDLKCHNRETEEDIVRLYKRVRC